jgi:hypothetical protein
MCLESIAKIAGESALIWHEKTGSVQPKVDGTNMLIQVRFFKVYGGGKQGIFGRVGIALNRVASAAKFATQTAHGDA